MKIAILSPQPRISGVVTYTHQLAEGFRDLGELCDVVTGTLSGKPSASSKVKEVDSKRSGWGWSTLGSDVTVKWADMVECLERYDVILVEEPRCAPLDKRQMRKLGDGDIKVGRAMAEGQLGMLDFEQLPPYIQALAQLKGKKIAMTLHDPGYGTRLAPFLHYFVHYVKPDLVITHRDGSYDSALWAGLALRTRRELRIPHLPYKIGAWQDRKKSLTVATTGRYINNKGQPTLFLAGALGHTPPWADLVALGASPLGAGPNHTFLTYEGLTKTYGWKGSREGKDVTRGWPWTANSIHGLVARYDGPYQDAVEALRDHAVHVCATDPAFSGSGSLEYVQLEAIDAGCALVMHRSRSPERGRVEYFEVTDIEKLANAELSPVDMPRKRTSKYVGEAVTRAIEFHKASPHRAALSARQNFEQVRTWHQPKRYASLVLEAL